MLKIGIQAGHAGRTSGSTGSPGEQELNIRIRARLTQLLVERGFQVYLFNADPPFENINQDFNLFLSLHGDANIYGTGGGFADYPEPSSDGVTQESQRICKIINESYFPETQIAYVNRSNANTRYYYMWKYLSLKTPCVIIEMGVVQDAHDKVLLGNTELIANALGRAICKAFGVTYDVAPPTPTEPDTCKQQLEEATAKIKSLEKDLFDQKNAYESKMAVIQSECNQKLSSYKNKIIQCVQELL